MCHAPSRLKGSQNPTKGEDDVIHHKAQEDSGGSNFQRPVEKMDNGITLHLFFACAIAKILPQLQAYCPTSQSSSKRPPVSMVVKCRVLPEKCCHRDARR